MVPDTTMKGQVEPARVQLGKRTARVVEAGQVEVGEH